ncbi:Crp/Fnr family transcriptional regulator [Halofilum ochraceum]|uniref:Crp/Fnr family transcriptional regulator n=1 Tax=Halofilum ochraceum TaxID=1611323 RepID=UPI0008D9A96B|nr:Crp/Fnr family transcriptional regulator [Halofilum ochraceum]
MQTYTHVPLGNYLVESLPIAAKNHVLARCETVELAAGDKLCEPGEDYGYAWFPLTGLISQGSKLRHHNPLDMGLIGSEGMLGATLALGVDAAPLQAVVTGAGTALRMRVADLRRSLRENDVLRQRIDHYLYIVFAELARTASCNRFHAIGPRLARCLLLATDRTSTNRLHLTHESMAAMLGVRRSGITVAARALRDQGLIRYARGEIEILDREGLKATACACYADWPSQRNGMSLT